MDVTEHHIWQLQAIISNILLGLNFHFSYNVYSFTGVIRYRISHKLFYPAMWIFEFMIPFGYYS